MAVLTNKVAVIDEIRRILIRTFHRLSLIILFCFLVGGCASSVEIRDEITGYQYTGEKFSKVELTVSQDATNDLEDLVRFDQDQLRTRIERNLEVRGLIDVNSENSVKVEINDLRVRSSVSAIILGILAGTDHVRGDVSLIGSNNRPFHTFYVSATYGLGGMKRLDSFRRVNSRISDGGN